MTAGSIQSASARESLQGLFGAAQGGLERLPLLRQALERTGPACAEEVRSLAAAPLRLALQGIDSGSAADVLMPGRGDRAVAVLGASGWDARLFASADRGAVFAIVEAMLGGDGSQPAHAAERALSKDRGRCWRACSLPLSRGRSSRPLRRSPPAPSASRRRPTAIDFDTIERDHAVVVARYRLERWSAAARC